MAEPGLILAGLLLLVVLLSAGAIAVTATHDFHAQLLEQEQRRVAAQFATRQWLPPEFLVRRPPAVWAAERRDAEDTWQHVVVARDTYGNALEFTVADDAWAAAREASRILNLADAHLTPAEVVLQYRGKYRNEVLLRGWR